MEAVTKAKKEYRRTISVELHEQWRRLYRVGDSDAIAKGLGLSKPTVDKALIYGNVHKEDTINFINRYFLDRLQRESDTAKRLQRAAEGGTTKQTNTNK